nr:MAG: Orc/Cdc6 origin recognition complex [uncultured archaeon]
MLKKPSVFKNIGSLDLSYIPKRLYCRDNEINSLIHNFRGIIDCKGIYSSNCLALGKGGIGKTTTVKFFCENFRNVALEKGIEINIHYYNCINYGTKSKIIRHLFEHYNFGSAKGLNDNETLISIIKAIKFRKKYIMLILDEVHLLPLNDLWALLDIPETFGHHNVRMSIILISRTFDWENIENERLLSRINKIIELKPYTYDQVRKILKYRYEVAFRDHLLDKTNIDSIAKIIEKKKNLRHGIEILRSCGQYVDETGISKLNIENIQNIASKIIYSKFRADIIDQLKPHNLFTFYAILIDSRLSYNQFVLVDTSYIVYKLICKELGIKPHVEMTFRKYIKDLAKLHLIISELCKISDKIRGRHLKIQLPFDKETAKTIEEDLKKYLENKFLKEN